MIALDAICLDVKGARTLLNRGHAPLAVAALGGSGASPLSIARSVVSASGKGVALAKQHQAVAWHSPATATRCAFT